jgi:predicted ATP-dependent protease
MQEEFKDAAYTFAKQRGDIIVDVAHVLFVIARKYKDRLQEQGVDIDKIVAYLGSEGESIKPPESFSDAATKGLESCHSASSAIEWVVETYRTLVIPNSPAASSSTAHAQTPQKEDIVHKAKEIGSAKPKRTVEEIYADLDALIGLVKVKKVIRDVVARQKAAVVMKERGQSLIFSKHLVFTGAPGTGKTTVARYIGELYAAINVLPGDAFVEVGRADLIGEYVGHTAPKVRAVVERARGGVLFIDEAYALMPTSANDYGHEALSTLVQLMENYRDDLVVIMAGYRHEMQAMIDSNPGLRSRMTTYIDFPNYSPDELSTIFKNIVESHTMQVSSDAVDYLQRELDTVVSHVGFGNARFVRSVWEHAFSHMASREFADGAFDTNELRTLQKEDVQFACDELLQGLRQQARHHTTRIAITRPGVVTGLAWTAAGGDILYLEAAAFAGDDTLRITGQLGNIMSESVAAALSCVRNMSATLGFPKSFFDQHSLHIHAPEGAIPKDGPSAGITLATAIASLATNRKVRDDVAMTGEITLYGRVLKVGGIREKVMAAHRVGIRTALIPYENLSDIDEIPQSIRDDMTIIGVQSVEEVFAHALGDVHANES